MVVRLAVLSPSTLARRAALGGAALLGALLASELALRAIRPFRHDPPLYVGDRPAATHARLGVLDPVLGWRLPSDAEVEDETPDYRVAYHSPGTSLLDFMMAVLLQPFRAPLRGGARRRSECRWPPCLPKSTVTRAGWLNLVRLFVALCGGLTVGGCVHLTEFPEQELPDKASAILPGQMTMEGVSNRLGKPLITSSYWGVELYRDASSQSEYPLAIVIPVGRITDRIYRYTLIAYDANGVVTSTATAIHRRPSSWRIARPIAYDHLTTQIQAGDFTFVNEWDDRQETLLVNPARRDAYLERVQNPARCTVVIGCGTGESSGWLQVDGGPTLPIPCRLRVQEFDQAAINLYRQGRMAEYADNYPIVHHDALGVLSLSPGSHTLKAWGGRWDDDGMDGHEMGGPLSGEQSLQFSCEAGETLYIVVDVSMEGCEKDWFWGWIPKGLEWRIDQYKEMPPLFANRPLLLYRGDQWLVSPEADE